MQRTHHFDTRQQAWQFFHLVSDRGGLAGFPYMNGDGWAVRTMDGDSL
jgi:hypothetical protein